MSRSWNGDSAVSDLGVARIRPGRNGALICTVCDKASFPTEDLAREAAENAHDPMYYYLGSDCRWWHLTRSPQGKEDQ